MNRYSDEDFVNAVASSDSIADVIRALGRIPAGGNYHTVKKKIENLNLDTSHFTGMLWSKGKSLGCKYPTEDYLSNKRAIHSHPLKLRLIKEGYFERKCYGPCGLSEWYGHPIPLELEHINGVHSDNSIENLTLLCPNCHSLTDTYRGKNIKRAGVKGTGLPPGLKIRGRAEMPIARSNRVTRTTKIEWPPKEEVLARLASSNYSKLARELGVSDNAIRKYLKR